MGASQKDIGTNVDRIPVAKSGQFEQQNDNDSIGLYFIPWNKIISISPY